MNKIRREALGSMTRREAVGLMGGAVAATAAVLGGAVPARGATRDLGSKSRKMCWVASITPCDKNLKFDPGAYRDIMAWFKHQGLDGFLALGTRGEFPSFSVAERKLIAATALKDKMGMNVLVNPGTANFPETLELARHAADHGADGLLVIPPFYYNDPPVAGLTRYYSMLFDQVHIPINLYHIPKTSGVPISMQLLKNLLHYPNLAGIKDSDPDMPEYEAFVKGFPELNMRTGTTGKLEYALDHGMGAILAEGNLFARQCADIFDACRAGQDYHPALARLRAAIGLFRSADLWSYGGMKYALSLEMGGPQTFQRPPFPDVTDEQKAVLRAAIEKLKNMS